MLFSHWSNQYRKLGAMPSHGRIMKSTAGRLNKFYETDHMFPEIWYLGKVKKSLVAQLFTTLVVSFQQAALNKYDKFAYVLLPLIFNSWVLVKYLCIWFILKLKALNSKISFQWQDHGAKDPEVLHFPPSFTVINCIRLANHFTSLAFSFICTRKRLDQLI